MTFSQYCTRTTVSFVITFRDHKTKDFQHWKDVNIYTISDSCLRSWIFSYDKKNVTLRVSATGWFYEEFTMQR